VVDRRFDRVDVRPRSLGCQGDLGWMRSSRPQLGLGANSSIGRWTRGGWRRSTRCRSGLGLQAEVPLGLTGEPLDLRLEPSDERHPPPATGVCMSLISPPSMLAGRVGAVVSAGRPERLARRGSAATGPRRRRRSDHGARPARRPSRRTRLRRGHGPPCGPRRPPDLRPAPGNGSWVADIPSRCVRPGGQGTDRSDLDLATSEGSEALDGITRAFVARGLHLE
jgi:hypothetical protein